jgi:hypothetical protein
MPQGGDANAGRGSAHYWVRSQDGSTDDVGRAVEAATLPPAPGGGSGGSPEPT